MPAMPEKPATTPIPVQLSESEFTQFILPHLTMPKRGPRCKLGYHRVFNLILWVLYTGMQWKCLPVPKDPVWSKNSCGFACVIFQKPPEPFTALNGPFTGWGLANRRKEQYIALALMIPLGMKMRHILPQRMAE